MYPADTHFQEQLYSLSHLSSLIEGDFQDLLASAVHSVALAMPSCSQASLWLQSEPKKGFICAVCYQQSSGLKDSDAFLSETLLTAFFYGEQNHRIIEVQDVQEDIRVRQLSKFHLDVFDTQALIAVAIRFNGELVAVLSCEYEHTASWSIAEKLFLSQLADQISLAYSNAEYKKLLQEKQTVNDIQQRLFVHSPDAILLLKNGIIQECNKAGLTLFGAANRLQVVGLKPAELSPEYQPCGGSSMIMDEELVLPENASFLRFDWVYRNVAGETFDAEVSLSTVVGWQNGQEMAIIRDVSQQKQHQKKLNQLAYICTLTGLANRSALLEFCDRQILKADGQLCLLALDVNNFKSINQSLGQAAGDAVLENIARRLQQFFLDSEGVCVARIGGNEFAVAVSENCNKMKLRLQAESLRHQMEQPVILDDMALSIAVTISICAYPDDGLCTGDLLGAVSVSMEEARDSFVPVNVAGQAKANAAEVRRLLLTQLETAILENQLSLFYQPKLDLKTRKCIGFEALIRWHHPDKGLVPPAEFIPLVEKTRLITPLTHWVIKNACEQLSLWLPINPELIIAVNLSTRNLLDQNLPGFIQHQLALYNIPPHHLQLEVTESSMMADPQRSIQTINDLHQLGTPLAIDDYGTGHSSLAYLRTLPVQVLKIDRTFIADVLKFEHDRIIVESILNLAHSLGLSVVAEGVEDIETQDYLTRIGCDETQGYYFSRPLPADKAEVFLRR